MGLGMFAVTAGGFVLRKLGRRRAATALPEVAKEFGLELKPPRYAGGQGRLRGRYRGHEVRVDPEDTREIAVRFESPPRVDLRTYEHRLQAPFGWATLHTGDRVFDRYFKTRFAAKDVLPRFAAVPSPSQYIQVFRGAYARQIQSLAVTTEGVTCRVNFGNPPHIPAEAIRTLLPACAELAAFIEATLDEASDSSQNE